MAKKRKPLRTPKGPASTAGTEGSNRLVISRSAMIVHPSPTRVPKAVATAHRKHKDDHSPPSPPHPNLADRFHALPPELREYIFALLLVQPIKYDLTHHSTCPLHSNSLPPNANIRPPIPYCQDTCGWHPNIDFSPYEPNPWRSKYAPPVRNPYLCSDCWDRQWRRPRPFPVVGAGDAPCLCARRRELDVLLVCPRWYAEAGRVFYSRNMFAFEDARTCLGFFGCLRREWREVVSSVSLVPYQGPGSDLNGNALESSKRLTQVWSLLRHSPALTRLELSAHYLEDEKILLPLLRLGPKNLRAVRFMHRMPASCLPQDPRASDGGAEARYIWPHLAHRILVRGGLAEQVGVVLKGQQIAWVRLNKAAKLEMLRRAMEWHQRKRVEVSMARDIESLRLSTEKGRYVLECCDLEEWERTWWMGGWQHAFLP